MNKKKQKALCGLRSTKFLPHVSVLHRVLKNVPYVVKGFVYNKKYLKELALLSNKYQLEIFYPGLTTLFPGMQMTCNFVNTHSKKTNYINFIANLGTVPATFFICYIKNILNVKFTFALSAGVCCIKIKTKKKIKLEKIKLPSNVYIFLTKYTLCVLGSLVNFKINTLKKGKFGAY